MRQANSDIAARAIEHDAIARKFKNHPSLYIAEILRQRLEIERLETMLAGRDRVLDVIVKYATDKIVYEPD